MKNSPTPSTLSYIALSLSALTLILVSFTPVMDSIVAVMTLAALIIVLVALCFAMRTVADQVNEKVVKNKIDGDLSRLASQVAHDIRSPLAALQTILDVNQEIGEAERIILRNASRRINEIASKLLTQRREFRDKQPVKITTEQHNLFLALDNAVSEKRTEIRSGSSSIALRIDQSAMDLFVAVPQVKLARVMSNLMNNALESTKDSSTHILVECLREGDFAKISIHDDGCGIPSHLMDRLFIEGFTHGKHCGNGLGLSHAKQSATEWGGELLIDSKEGEGTSVTITLPLGEKPNWFTTDVSIPDNSTVVIVDDDCLVHDQWKARLGNRRQVYLNSPEEFVNWVSNKKGGRSVYVLMDQEFSGSKVTGVELIQQFSLESCSLLVTGHFEEPAVSEACSNGGIKILAKGLIQRCNIRSALRLVASEAKKYVLVDDDVFVRESWKIAADAKGVNLETFESPNELMNNLAKLSRETEVYLDLEMGEGLNGLTLARQLYDRGYRNVHLATGNEKSEFSDIAFLTSIIGKNPPEFCAG